MKKLVLSFSLAFFMFGFQKMEAQVDVTANPIGLIFGNVSAGADVAVNENFSLDGSFILGNSRFFGLKIKNNPVVTLTGKYYFSPNHGADGFYGDLFFRYVNRNHVWKDETVSDADFTITKFGMGFGIGYKIASAKGLVFDFGAGFGRAFSTKIKYELNGDQTSSPWFPYLTNFKLNVGYRFGGGERD